MAITDPLGDLLTRIRNAQMRRRPRVASPSSKLRCRVLDVLKDEGYIRGYAEVEDAKGFRELDIELKYYDGDPVISQIKRVSKPGRRVYSSIGDLGLVGNGLGVAILSTSKGVLSDEKARAENVGGEVLCHVF